jgi:hypothetical protein
VLAGNPLALLGVFQFVRRVINEFQVQHALLEDDARPG